MLPVPIVAANDVMKACSGESGPLAPDCRLASVSRNASRKRKTWTNRKRMVKNKPVAMSVTTNGNANHFDANSIYASICSICLLSGTLTYRDAPLISIKLYERTHGQRHVVLLVASR